MIRSTLAAFTLLSLVVVGTGCSTTYSSIQKNGDNSYTLTRTKAGFFRTYGTVYRCQPRPDQSLGCEEIDSP